jgi:putative transposase
VPALGRSLHIEGLAALVEQLPRQWTLRSLGLASLVMSTGSAAQPFLNPIPELAAIGHAKDRFWSVDLFRAESILLKSYWVMVVMDGYTRRIIGFGVAAANLDGIRLCRMFNRAISGEPLPRHLSSDHDPSFRFHRWRANLRVLDIDEIKSIPGAPRSHAFVERLIGTIRREYLDRVCFWHQSDLQRKLDDYQTFCNQYRCHTGLGE